jgi:hypothetical protein
MADEPQSNGPGMGYPSAGVLPSEAPGTPDEVSGRVSFGLPQHTVPAPAQAVSQPPAPAPEAAPVAPAPTPAAVAPVVAPTPAVIPLVKVNAPWATALEQSAATAGVDADILHKFAEIESSGGKTSSNVLQIQPTTADAIRSTYPSLNVGDVNDPNESARVAPFLLKSNNAAFQTAMGRPPTPGEAYLQWFSGPTGGVKVAAAAPNTPISQLLSPKAIANNPDVFDKVHTAGELRNWADQKMGQAPSVPADQAQSNDMRSFFSQRAPSHLDMQDLNSTFASRIQAISIAAEQATGAKVGFSSLARSHETQTELYENHVARMNGQPLPYPNQEAPAVVARPGSSLHERGLAVDFNDGPALDWIRAHAEEYGLAHIGMNDKGHIQIAGGSSYQATGGTVGAPIAGDPGTFHGHVSVASAVPSTPITDTDRANAAEYKASQAWGVAGAAYETLKNDGLTANLMRDARDFSFEPDPTYKVTPQDLTADERTKSLDQNQMPYLLEAVSKDDFESRIASLQKQQDYEQHMAASGASGVIGSMVGNLMDPTGWLAYSIPAMGGAAYATKWGRALWEGGANAALAACRT